MVIVTDSKTTPYGVISRKQLDRLFCGGYFSFVGVQNSGKVFKENIDAAHLGIEIAGSGYHRLNAGHPSLYETNLVIRNPDKYSYFIDLTSSLARTGTILLAAYDENGDLIQPYPNCHDSSRFTEQPKGRIKLELFNPFFDVYLNSDKSIANLRLINHPEKALLDAERIIKNRKSGSGSIALLGRDKEPIERGKHIIDKGMLVLCADTKTADNEGSSAYILHPNKYNHLIQLEKRNMKADFFYPVEPCESLNISKDQMLFIYHQYSLFNSSAAAFMPYTSPLEGIERTNAASMINPNGIPHPQAFEVQFTKGTKIRHGNPIGYLIFYKMSEEHKPRKKLGTNGNLPGKLFY